MKMEIELPTGLLSDIADIKEGLNQLLKKEKAMSPHNAPEVEWITPAAFNHSTGTKRSFFERHKHQMNTKHLNRKTYVHRDEVKKYFEGAFNK